MTQIQLLQLAAQYAIAKRDLFDKRTFRLGAVGIRADGTIVHARNGSSYNRFPRAHAEARLAQKLDVGAIVFVSRIGRDYKWALAKPCKNCEILLARIGVKKVYFTIAPDEFDVYSLQ